MLRTCNLLSTAAAPGSLWMIKMISKIVRSLAVCYILLVSSYIGVMMIVVSQYTPPRLKMMTLHSCICLFDATGGLC